MKKGFLAAVAATALSTMALSGCKDTVTLQDLSDTYKDLNGGNLFTQGTAGDKGLCVNLMVKPTALEYQSYKQKTFCIDGSGGVSTQNGGVTYNFADGTQISNPEPGEYIISQINCSDRKAQQFFEVAQKLAPILAGSLSTESVTDTFMQNSVKYYNAAQDILEAAEALSALDYCSEQLTQQR